MATKNVSVEILFCPACPMEARDLYECAKNVLVWHDAGDVDRMARRLEDLRRSIARFEPLVAKHFEEKHESA